MDSLNKAIGFQQELSQTQFNQNKFTQLRADSSNPTNDREKLKQVSKDFEAIFVKQLLEAMEKTLDRENDLFNGGQAEKTLPWNDFMMRFQKKYLKLLPVVVSA